MLGNWVNHTTTSTGAGNLTLTPVTGWPTAAAVFGQNRFAYIANTDDGLPLESGEGYLLPDGVTFVRDRVLNNMEGGVFNGAPLGPMVLPAGTKKIQCAPTAHTGTEAGRALDMTGYYNMGVQTQSAANLLASASMSAANLPVNTAFFSHFLKDVSDPIRMLGLRITTAGAAGSTAAVGIFAMSARGAPGRNLLQVMLPTTTTGEVYVTLPQPCDLPPGTYWSCVSSSATFSCNGADIMASAGAPIAPGTDRRVRYWSTGRVDGSAPYEAEFFDSIGASKVVGGVNNLNAPVVFWKA